MRKVIVFLFVLSTLTELSYAQRYTTSGYVKDGQTGETLIGSSIGIKTINKGTTANEYGFYSLTLEQGIYVVQCSFIGYQTIVDTIQLFQNVRRNFTLSGNSVLSKEVEITAEKSNQNYKSTEMG